MCFNALPVYEPLLGLRQRHERQQQNTAVIAVLEFQCVLITPRQRQNNTVASVLKVSFNALSIYAPLQPMQFRLVFRSVRSQLMRFPKRTRPIVITGHLFQCALITHTSTTRNRADKGVSCNSFNALLSRQRQQLLNGDTFGTTPRQRRPERSKFNKKFRFQCALIARILQLRMTGSQNWTASGFNAL